MSTDDRAVGAPERLHPLFLLTGLGGSLRGIAGGYAAIGYLVVSGQARTALFGAIALFVFLIISVLAYWLRFSFRVGENEIRIDSGLFSRTHRSIPFDRIQDVDISQGPVARLAGLARVKFETGGSAGGDRDEGVLQAIPLARAEELRVLIRSHRLLPVDGKQEEAAVGEGQPVFAMDTRRVLLAGVFNFSLALFAGLFGATQTFGDVAGFDPLSRAFWLQILQAGDPLADYILAHQVAAGIAGVMLLLLAGLLTGTVRTLLREYGFRLDRTDVGLRRRRGLLTRTDVTLPLKRAQAAIIGTGPVREAFGWRDLKLQSLARDEGGSGDHVLAPLATEDEVANVLSQLEWPPIPGDVQWLRVSPTFVFTLVIGLAPLMLLAVVQALLLPLAGIGLGLVIAGAILLRTLAWRRTAYVLTGDRLLMRSGWWRRRLLILPVGKIQSLDFHQSLIGRWFGTASLVFGVAGGSGFSGHAIPALPADSARELRQRLLVSQA